MATWRDGPEYAPLERPAAFVVPEVGPLPAASPRAVPRTPDAPAEEPSFTPPEAELPDLAALVPSAAPGRNPQLPFEVAAATITAGGGSWSAGPPAAGQQLRSPTQPFNAPGPPLSGYLPVQQAAQPHAPVNPTPFPAPGTPQWFAPPPLSRVPAAPPPVSIGQIWRAATPGVLIPLLVGAVFSWLSIFMLAISFALSARIAYRKDAVRRAYVIALLGLAVVGSSTVLGDGFYSDLLFERLSGGAQLACLVLPVAIGLIVGAALRAGEPPDRVT